MCHRNYNGGDGGCSNYYTNQVVASSTLIYNYMYLFSGDIGVVQVTPSLTIPSGRSASINITISKPVESGDLLTISFISSQPSVVFITPSQLVFNPASSLSQVVTVTVQKNVLPYNDLEATITVYGNSAAFFINTFVPVNILAGIIPAE